MQIKTKCPSCATPYMVADTMEGKQVRCKKCAKSFTVARTEPKAEEAIVAAVVEEEAPLTAIVEDDAPVAAIIDEENVPLPKRPSRKRDLDDEDGDDRPRRKTRSSWDSDDEDDDADDDDRSRRRKRAATKAGSNSMMWIIIGSAAAVVLVAGIGLFLVLRPKEDPELAKLKQLFEGDANKFAQDFQRDMDKLVKELPKDFKADIPFFEKEKALSLAEHLQNLKTGDDRAKTQAASYFGRTDPNVPERAEVAKALEALAEAPNPLGGVNKAFTNWATKEQAPTLVKLVQKNTGPSHNAEAMLALARLKDDKGASAIAAHLGDIFARNNARKALQEYGPDAQAGLIRTMFHKNGNTRLEVQKFLKELNAPTDRMYPQAVKDLNNAEKESRIAAADWLAQNAVNETYRADAAKGLESMLGVPDARRSALKAMETWATKDNVPALADLLPQDNVPRVDILRVLGKLKDERAAAAIAARLQSDRQPAADALRAIGPGAEKAVLAYLNHTDGGVSAEARKLLKEWNTKNDVLIGQTIKDLDAATDAARRRPALGFLTQADVEDALRGKVNKALEPLLTDNMVQGDAYKAFFHWAGRESLPILIKLIVSDPSPYRRQAMDAAAKLKDENAAGAIATRLPTGDRAYASKTLKSMGSIAERAVVKYLGNNDAGVRIEVLYILREIGTRASVPFVLQAMKADPKNKNLIKAAQEAGAAMSGR